MNARFQSLGHFFKVVVGLSNLIVPRPRFSLTPWAHLLSLSLCCIAVWNHLIQFCLTQTCQLKPLNWLDTVLGNEHIELSVSSVLNNWKFHFNSLTYFIKLFLEKFCFSFYDLSWYLKIYNVIMHKVCGFIRLMPCSVTVFWVAFSVLTKSIH